MPSLALLQRIVQDVKEHPVEPCVWLGDNPHRLAIDGETELHLTIIRLYTHSR